MRFYTLAVFLLGGVAGAAAVAIPAWPEALAVLLALLIAALSVADVLAAGLDTGAP